LEVKPASATAGKVSLLFAGTELSKPADVELRPENQFEFARKGRSITLRWNGNDVSATLPEDYTPSPDTLVGLGFANQGRGAVTEVTKLEIRGAATEL
jgi:hypothetical protein